MKLIKLDDVEYKMKTSIDDLTIKEYFDIQSINSERELVDEEYVERGKESEEFIKNKHINILSYLSKIDKNIFYEYPFLVDELNNFVESFSDNSEIWEQKEINKKTWQIDNYSKWTFQEWCDIENYVSKTNNILYGFYVLVYIFDKRTKKRKYDRHQNINNIKTFWENQPIKGNLNTILDLLDTIYNIKQKFYYIYEAKSPTFGTYNSDNLKKYHKIFGWEDTIIQIAETNLFNSINGSLFAVRNANAYEVLEYLNLKTARDIAENSDYINNNKKT